MSAETIKAIAELAWPVIAALFLLFLLPSVRKVAQSRAFTVKYGQMELSVQDASDQLRKQVDDLQDQVRALQTLTQSRPAVPHEPPPPSADRPRRTILWVDDKPQGNAHEIAKLQGDGWEIVTVASTREALEFLHDRSTRPTVIISDMARKEGLTYSSSAGLDLIREVRAKNINVPIFVYTASSVERYRSLVTEAKGNGITASPMELFRLVEGAA